MAAQNSSAANAASLSQKLKKLIADGSLDYDSWRLLIQEIESACPEDVDTISSAYDSFLSAFPLCHWHLEKYANYKARLCGVQEAIKIFEQRAGTAMFSVGFWVDYCTFATACSGDSEDVRRLFGRAFSFVGKDYFSHALWDKYMKYEFSQEGWGFLAQGYIQSLQFPTKKLKFYYDNFKQFVANLEEEMGYVRNQNIEVERVSGLCAATRISRDEISLVVKDLLHSSDRSLKSKALDRYRSMGEAFYQEACHMNEKIKRFEANIQRRYFSVTPLDIDQLSNWHLYLDFIEKQDNMDSALKLYERCLIPCANYPEFWMRYVEFLESKGGREMAISALDRATQIFLKNVPEIHLFCARFKEHIRDANGARAALLLCDTKADSVFVEKVAARANMERRLGNFAAAAATYEKALKTVAKKQKLHVLPSLYSQFSRLTFLISGSADSARDVLIDGVRHVPHSRFLLEELIRFSMTHEGANQVNTVDSIVADAISPGLDGSEGLEAKDRQDISFLFLEFVNLCGTIQDVRKAWNRHIRLFPQFLRISTTYKHSTSGNHLLDTDREKKRSYDVAAHDQPLGKETTQNLATKALVPSNEIASQDNELVHDLSVVGNAEFANQTKDKPRQMDITDELANQSTNQALSPSKTAHEVGNSSRTIKSVEASNTSLINVQLEPDNEFKHQQQPVSSDNNSLNSQEKNSKELIPTSKLSHNDVEREGSVKVHADQSNQMVTEPSTEKSGFHGHTQDQEQKSSPANLSDSKTMMNVDNAQQARRSQSPGQPAPIQEDYVTDQARPMSMMNTPSNISTGQSTPSPSPISYPLGNMNQTNSLSGQNTWQTHQMNQMLQYHYHQQQLLQQQYQQQQQQYLQMQQHYMNQQAYQQHYVQQQQLQSSPYQQNLQLQQGQGSHLNYQQAHEKQYSQSQELAYQAHQLGYPQQAAQGQQLILQQYQQYQQGYQHPLQKQQDEQLQLHHPQVVSQQNPAPDKSQTQQGPRTAPSDHDGAAEASEPRRLRVESPQDLQ